MKTIKRNRKALLCLALVVMVIASIFVITGITSSAATVKIDDTFTFSATKFYEFEKAIPEFSSYTFETEFWIDPTVWGDGRAYNFFGNWADNGQRDNLEFNIELHKYGSLRLMSQKHGSVYFGPDTTTASAANAKTSTDLRQYMKTDENGNPIFVKLTVTVDATTGNAYLYVDGNKVGEILENAKLKGKTYSPSAKNKHRIGLDQRTDTNTYFKGSIKSIAMYDYVRSDISAFGAPYASSVCEDDGLMFAYDLTDLKVNGGYLNDYSKNQNTAFNPNWTANGIGKTFTVQDDLHLVKDIDVMPKTFEALVYAPSEKADGTTLSRPGVILGNYQGSGASLNFELHSNGMATIHLDPDKDTGAATAKIADARNNYGFVHIVIVRSEDTSNGYTYHLYIDGKYAAEALVKDSSGNVITNEKFASLDMEEVQKTYKFQLGGDSRSNNERWFQGNMRNVALYSEALTPEEIYASYKNGVGTVKNKDNGLILHYDMNTVETSDYVKDVSGNGYHATQGGLSLDRFSIGRSFTAEEKLYVQKKLEVMPKTYEALVYVPADNRPGVIIGNYGGSTCVNFEIHGSESNPRRPSIYITDSTGTTMDTKFDYNLTPNAWAHIVITHEVTSGGSVFTCYVNGENVASFTKTNTFEFDSEINDDNYLMLGGDCRSGNAQYYKGRIKNVALYSSVLTADEIKALYTNGVDTDNESLILHYDLTKKENQTGTTVIDESGNGYNTGAKNLNPFHARENEIGDYDYAFAIVGDTQKLMYKDATEGTNYVSYIYDWLIANKDSKKIKLVMGVGDVTDKNLDTEYVLAKSYFEELGNAGMLYSITPGNHDMSSGKYANYNKYFAGYGNAGEEGYIAPLTSLTSNISGYYGAVVDGVHTEDKTQVTNYYIKTAIDGEKYIIFSFEYGAPDDILTWAGEICDANKDYKVIITTHAYMYRDGTTLDSGDVVPPNKDDSTSDDHRNNGDMTWDKFVSQHENIVMVFSGHDPCANIVMRQDMGVNGNLVSQFLVDFQSMDTSLNYETGMVAMLYISKNGNVQVEYISAYQTIMAQKTDSQAPDMLYKERNSFTFNMYEYPEELVTEYGLIPYEYRNSDDYPFIIFDENKNFKYAVSNFLGAIDKAKSYMSKNVYDETLGKYTDTYRQGYIVLTRDYAMSSTESNNNLSQVQGLMTIDLQGHTITTTASGKNMFPSSVKPWVDSGDASVYPTEFVVKNGNVIVNKTLVSFNAWSNNGIDVSGKKFAYTFENIVFEVSQNVSEALVTYTLHSSTPEAEANPELNFTDCVFDLTNAMSGVVLFNLGNAYTDAKITVTGCEIIAQNADFVLYTETDKSDGATTNDGTLTFEKNEDGKYVYITVENGAALPELDINEGQLVFVKTSAADGKAVYTLCSASVKNFKIKTSITLYSNFIYNIYIPTANFNKATVDGKDVVYSEVVIEGISYYHIRIDLPAGETLSDIRLTVNINADGAVFDATWTLNVLNYTKAILAGEYDNVTKTLMKDMLAYAHAAHTYFENTDDEADKLLEVENLLDGYSATLPTGEAKQPNNSAYFTDVAVYLGDVPSFRVYLADGYTMNDFTFTVGTRASDVKSGEDKDGKYVEITMYAYMMLDDINYTVNGTDVTGTYNLYSYYEYVKTLGNANLTAIVEGLMKYSVSAANYRDSVIGK